MDSQDMIKYKLIEEINNRIKNRYQHQLKGTIYYEHKITKIYNVKRNIELKARRVMLYHGSNLNNIKDILETGFNINKLGTNTNNTGFYGNGFYFTNSLPCATNYSKTIKTPAYVLDCDVYLGNIYHCQEQVKNCTTINSIKNGYDSHSGKCSYCYQCMEYVVDNKEYIIVRRIIEISPP